MMRKIINPFPSGNSSSYNCFGCSPANAVGLHLEFWQDGETLLAEWQPQKSFEGWAGILHGGIQATLADEAAAWLVFTCLETAGVTSEMQIRYLKPLYIAKGPITVRATLLTTEKRMARIKCLLHDVDGELCAEADLSYLYFPQNVARAKYGYPGIDAFFEE